LAVIGNLGSAGNGPEASPSRTPAGAVVPSATPVATVELTPEPSDPPTAEPVETPARTSSIFEDIELTGRGSKVVRFTIPEDAAAVARITHRGSSNFIVETLDENGDTNDLLVNEIGTYEGNHLFDDSAHSVAFKVDADGRWRILVRHVTKARAWNPSKTLAGDGPDVVRLTQASEGFTTLDIRHRGSSNFVVYAYSVDGRELLVNEIGSYSGEVLLPAGTLIITVEADGTWTGTPG
jgi:hypothetical protein